MTTRILLWDSGFSAPRAVAATFAAGRHAVMSWRMRRSRVRSLGDLDDHLLHDLGLDVGPRHERALRLRFYAVEGRGRAAAPVFLGR